jgi:hypothetical protein
MLLQDEKALSNLSTRLTDHLAHINQTTLISPLSAALSLFAWYPHPSSAEVLHCRVCERRVGLWAFVGEGSREFDLVDEHVGWCPIRTDGWWVGSEMLRGKRQVLEVHEVRGLIRISEKLERKRWRKTRPVNE